MSKIFLTSDLHFGHDREFIWGPRGFASSEEHDKTIVANWNSVVSPEDTVYVLGDLMLGDNTKGTEYINQLNGNIYVIRGNHDTDNRWNNVYANIEKLNLIGWADVIHYKRHHFFLSHFPSETTNLENESLKQCTLNLFGHTHSKDKFRNDIPFYYNVALDAHNNFPVLLDDIIEEMRDKYVECLNYL